MDFCFKGDISDLEKGLDVFAGMLDYQISPTGLSVQVEKCHNGYLEVEKVGSEVIIRYEKKIHFFRAVGLLVQRLRENSDDFKIVEEPQFTMNGAMFDVSQGNAVINIRNVKKFLDRMAVMGLNMLMLYAEDSFEIDGEPYFGYMRSKYTFDEMKELDDYADTLGIEMIPCVQTLAHLIDALKWDCYKKIREDDDTLLVGSPKAYELIEKIIRSASAPFRTKRIHIGMDEAWKLGQGEYLLINGHKNKLDIMTEHLNKVLEITNQYGLKPMIWSDMYFRAGSSSGLYYDTDCKIPQEVMDRTPEEVQLVYWDYYHDNEEFYTDWIERHKKFGSTPIFAGGIWSWTGFAANYGATFANTNAALNACKKEDVKEVFTTIWGDDSTESNVFCNLLGLQLFAEHGYSKVLDEEKLKSRFAFCTGCNYDDFMAMSALDEVPGCKPGNPDDCNPSKYLVWQDVLMGLFDKNVEGLNLDEHYHQLEARMKQGTQRNGEFGFIFEYLQRVCAVLSTKAEMGLKLVDAYKRGDRAKLAEIASSLLPSLMQNAKALREYHRGLWMQINKPAGWEIMDARYGFLLTRIDTAIYRISEYLALRIDAIEELEQERLDFQGTPGLVACNVYNRMPSASRISMTTSYIF